MPDFMKAKMAGLPRWAWALMLAGGIGVGLYLRSRTPSEDEEEFDEEGAPVNEFYGEGTGSSSLVGTAPGQVVPVEAPYLPEGFVDIFGSLNETLSVMGEVLGEVVTNRDDAGVTGGGPPPTPERTTEPPPDTSPPPPAPEPQGCPHEGKIRNNRAESDRLEREINSLRGQVGTLQNNINRYPNANKRAGWIRDRKQKEKQISNKRQKRADLAAANRKLRKTAGCG